MKFITTNIIRLVIMPGNANFKGAGNSISRARKSTFTSTSININKSPAPKKINGNTSKGFIKPPPLSFQQNNTFYKIILTFLIYSNMLLNIGEQNLQNNLSTY